MRLRIFIAIVIVAIGLLTARLIHLQVINAEYYAGESEKNAVRLRVTQSARGLIYDRNGVLLVDNVPTYSLTVTPRYFDEERIPLLARLLEVPDSTVRARLDEASAWSPYQASRIFREVPFQIFSRVEEHLYQLPGVEFIVDDKRHYHGGVRASHVYGYVKEISERQLDTRKEKGYRQGDRLGQSGLERSYEPALRGESGRRFMMVNVHGQEVKSYREGSEDVPPQSGANLTLTIDANLQALVERLYENKRGGAVAIDPRNGEILALISSPDYDPRLLSGSVSQEVWKGLQDDPFKPLFNRATMSGQPPGSTFKPFMALVGLQTGVITPQTTVTCHGVYYFGRPFKCHGGAHGTLTVRDAIKRSCNVFFYTLMMRLDFDKWSKWGPEFGFGVVAPTDLPEVVSGLLPDSAYFDRAYPRGWTRGYLVSLGIGQGDMVITPLQLARYAAALANAGTLHSPHVVRSAVDPQTGEAFDFGLEPSHRIPISPEHFETVREGMRRMVMENNSTVRWGDVVVAGKTGTAQNPHGEDHSWFMGFAPFDDPKIAVAVLVENAGYGATVSAPIAGLMMEQYLTGSIDQHPQFVKDMALRGKSEGMENGEGMQWRHYFDREEGRVAAGMPR
ncbi:MAG TPA: penicillin-binding protein 2 [Rhodothermales bacterium]|nr:penicillin-binding protein 2 [Rhodothermales bacterium]